MAGPLFSQGKKINSILQKASNIQKMIGLFLGLLGMLYYSIVNRKAVLRGRKLSAAHARDLF